MFENPILIEKPMTIALRSDMTTTISDYIAYRKLGNNIIFNFDSGLWLDRHQKNDNKITLRKEWCEKLTPMLGLSETRHLCVWDVVTTNLQFEYLITEIEKALIDHEDEDFNAYLDEWSRTH